MSKSTLRKRIALTAVTTLFAGMLSVASAPVANANATHPAAGVTNATAVLSGANLNASMYTATASNTGGAAVVAVDTIVIGNSREGLARSTGLLQKDSSSSTAQTATLLTSGRLSLYAPVSTDVAFTASAGTFASATTGYNTGGTTMVAYSDPAKTVLLQSWQAATLVAALWTAPSTAGTYTVSLYRHSGTTAPTVAVPSGGSLAAQITVTVVAASTGGTLSLVYSACNTDSYARTATGTDSTTSNLATSCYRLPS